MGGASDKSITTNMWTSNKQEAYISITAHWLDDSLNMQHAVLATPEMPESHTGVNIKERIEQCLRDFGIEMSVVAYVADNGSNVVAALNNMPAPAVRIERESTFISNLGTLITRTYKYK